MGTAVQIWTEGAFLLRIHKVTFPKLLQARNGTTCPKYKRESQLKHAVPPTNENRLPRVKLTDCADAECANYRERWGVDAGKAIVYQFPHSVVNLKINVFSKLSEKIFNLLVQLTHRLQGKKGADYQIGVDFGRKKI